MSGRRVFGRTLTVAALVSVVVGMLAYFRHKHWV